MATTPPSFASFPSNLNSVQSPQCEMYAIWHVCRAMKQTMSCAQMGAYNDVLSIEFRKDSHSHLSYATLSRPTAAPIESFCFFTCPPVPKTTPCLNDVFNRMRPRLEQLFVTPAVEDEFSRHQVLTCESLGHEARIKASVERDPARRGRFIKRAAFMYEAGLRMIGHATVLTMLNRIARHPKEVYVVRINDEADSMSYELRRFISSSFAGLAICALYENDFARIGSFSSLAVGWDDVGGIVLVSTVRAIAMLDEKMEMYLFITRNILMPYVVQSGRGLLFEEELRTCIPDALRDRTRSIVLSFAGRFGRGMMTEGVHVRTRIVDGRVVERICAKCEANQGKLRHCAGCKSVYYCSKQCQTLHWTQHKPFCVRVSGEA